MGQSAPSSCSEGCCRQHVFPDKVSDTVKVDVSLLHESLAFALDTQKCTPQYHPGLGGKENTQPMQEAAGGKEFVQPLQEVGAVKVQAAMPPQMTLKSWEAGWLGTPSVDGISNGIQDVRIDQHRGSVRCQSTEWVEASTQTPVTPLARQTAQFRLPDEETPVLTELLGLPAMGEAKATSPPESFIDYGKGFGLDSDEKRWLWHAGWRSGASSERGTTTPTTSAGHSSPGGSPITCRMASPAMSIGCRSSEVGPLSRVASPASGGVSPSAASQNLEGIRMQQAQSLLASMLDPVHGGRQASGGCSTRRSSEPPCPAPLSGQGPQSAARNRSSKAKSNESRRSFSCKPSGQDKSSAHASDAKVSRLQPLNGSMPQFPAAGIDSLQQAYGTKKQ